MAVKRTTRRPVLRTFGKWEGNNVAELEAAFPGWVFTENLDGTLHATDGQGFDGDLQQGWWFSYDSVYEDDAQLAEQTQDVPSGVVSFDLTGE